MKALRHIIKKEFLQIRRTRSMIAITLGVPVIQLVILGFAISSDVVHVPTVITDMDNSSTSRRLVNIFENSRYLDVRYKFNDIREAEDMLLRGKTILAVTIPGNFEKDLIRHRHPQVSVSADAQNTNVALTGAGYVRRIIFSWVQRLRLPGSAGNLKNMVRLNTISAESRIWYNPELKSMYYMVPGIMGLLVTIITIILTSMAIVREREMGTLEQLMVSPITRTELILGKTIPFIILGLVELSVSLMVIRLLYRVPINGSLTSFMIMTIVYIFCTLGIGIFISTISATQQQALFTSWFIMIFCIIMSGFLLPLENMPKGLIPLTYINPLRYYMSIIRELFLKGAGFAELWRNVLALGIIALVVMTASVARFHKKIG